MRKLDKEKEIIGYLKVVFSILIAIDVSLVAWLYKNFDLLNTLEKLLTLCLIIVFTSSIIYVNKKILYKIDCFSSFWRYFLCFI